MIIKMIWFGLMTMAVSENIEHEGHWNTYINCCGLSIETFHFFVGGDYLSTLFHEHKNVYTHRQFETHFTITIK